MIWGAALPDTQAIKPGADRASAGGARFWLVAVMLAGSVYSGLIFVVVGPILPNLARHFGPDKGGDVLAQWVMTAPAIGLVIGGLGGGWLLNRCRLSVLLPTLLLTYGIAGSAGAFLESPALLLLSRFLIGLCAVTLSLAATVLIAETFTGAARAKMLGYKNSIASGASIVSTLVAGQMADLYGWRVAFLIYAIPLVLVVPALLGLRDRPEVPAEESRSKLLAPVPAGWSIYLAAILFGVLVMAPLTQLPFLLREIGITGAATLSHILGFSSVGATFGAFLYGRTFALLGSIGTLVGCMVLWATGMVTLGTTGSVPQTIVGCLICGVAGAMFVVHMSNLLVSRVAPADRGNAAGLLYVALFVGDFLTPLVLVPLASSFGRHATFLILAIPCAMTALGACAIRWRNSLSA